MRTDLTFRHLVRKKSVLDGRIKVFESLLVDETSSHPSVYSSLNEELTDFYAKRNELWEQFAALSASRDASQSLLEHEGTASASSENEHNMKLLERCAIASAMSRMDVSLNECFFRLEHGGFRSESETSPPDEEFIEHALNVTSIAVQRLGHVDDRIDADQDEPIRSAPVDPSDPLLQ